MTTTLSQGFAYDATAILGFGPASAEPLPDAAPGEIIIRYSGWSLQELRNSDIGMQLVYHQDWYNNYSWNTETLPVGNYRLRIPVRDSNRKTFPEQERLLSEGEQVAPVVLVASALLAHRLQTGEDLLKNDFTRCREQAADGTHVGLDWYGGRLVVGSYWGDFRHGSVWLSSVRKC